MRITAESIRSSKKNWRALKIVKPRPALEPSSSAATSVPQQTPIATRRPVNISGNALGRITWRSTWTLEAPSEYAAWTLVVLTASTPERAAITMIQIAANSSRLTLPSSPMPNHTMNSGISASGGMGRRSSTTGSKIPLHRLDRPIASPMGTPMATPQKSPLARRLKLSQRCSHMVKPL